MRFGQFLSLSAGRDFTSFVCGNLNIQHSYLNYSTEKLYRKVRGEGKKKNVLISFPALQENTCLKTNVERCAWMHKERWRMMNSPASQSLLRHLRFSLFKWDWWISLKFQNAWNQTTNQPRLMQCLQNCYKGHHYSYVEIDPFRSK